MAKFPTDGKSAIIDFDFVKKVVDSNPHTYEFVSNFNGTVINAGGLYKDPDTNIVYMYCDFTVNANTSGNFERCVKTDKSTPTTLMTKFNGSSVIYYESLCHVESYSSASKPTWFLQNVTYNDKNYMVIVTTTTSNVKSGSHHVVWGIWLNSVGN